MKHKGKIFMAALVSLLGCVIVCFAGLKIYAEKNEDTIADGVYIDSVALGGNTVEEASEKVDNYIKELENKTVTLTVGEDKVTTTLENLGFQCTDNDYIEQAYDLGKTGNLIKRYKELQDIKNESIVYNLEFTIDEQTAKDFIDDKCKKYEVEPVDATMTRKDGKFAITAETVGRTIQEDDTIEKIKSVLTDDWDYKDITLELVMADVQPDCTKAQLKKCTDVLGDFSTSYSTSSSSRAANLENASNLINGTIVLPGEEFSTTEAISPITEDNGYEVAGAYSNGTVVDSVGGGVCQVATTLYNAVLKAELEVTERYNHSMIVTYVQPSMDAAISEGYKDFKFKNNTDTPIYIQSYTQGRIIYFVIYGEETRDTENRKVVYQSEVVETIQPGDDIITEDSTKPTSYRLVEQSAHVGYKARLWKIVYENGEQVSKEQVNSSSYAAEPAHVIVGTKEEEKDDDKADKDDDTSDDTTKKDSSEETDDSKTTTDEKDDSAETSSQADSSSSKKSADDEDSSSSESTSKKTSSESSSSNSTSEDESSTVDENAAN